MAFIINFEGDEVYQIPYLGIIVSCAWDWSGGEWSNDVGEGG